MAVAGSGPARHWFWPESRLPEANVSVSIRSPACSVENKPWHAVVDGVRGEEQQRWKVRGRALFSPAVSELWGQP